MRCEALKLNWWQHKLELNVTRCLWHLIFSNGLFLFTSPMYMLLKHQKLTGNWSSFSVCKIIHPMLLSAVCRKKTLCFTIVAKSKNWDSFNPRWLFPCRYIGRWSGKKEFSITTTRSVSSVGSPRVSKQNVLATIFGLCYDSLNLESSVRYSWGKALVSCVCRCSSKITILSQYKITENGILWHLNGLYSPSKLWQEILLVLQN